MRASLPKHRAHDYRHLIRRWRKVAKTAGLRMQKYAEADGHPCYYLTAPPLESTGGIYLSAGIHGDEAGASESCIAWAEKHADSLGDMPLIIFPCLNPWGLTNNSRTDARGNDLNRGWEAPTTPAIRKVCNLIKGQRFALALTLHEDFDGQGFYLYEPARKRPYWGESILEAAAKHIAIDQRTRIDTSRAKAGVIRRQLKSTSLPSLPEAVFLHLEHAERTFTFETPSEFSLDQRISTGVAAIERAVELTI